MRDLRPRVTRTGVVTATDSAERQDAFGIRYEVFVKEQGVPEELEWDGLDADAVHFVAYDRGIVVGAARLRLLDDETGKVERVAVLTARRGEGWGRQIMEAVEEEAMNHDLNTLKLNAQTSAVGFYRSLGYDGEGPVFEEAGIPHVEMSKSLVDATVA